MLIDFSNIDFDQIRGKKEIPQYFLVVSDHLKPLFYEAIALSIESSMVECIRAYRASVARAENGYNSSAYYEPVEGSKIELQQDYGSMGSSYKNTVNRIYYYGNNLHTCIPKLVEHIREAEPSYTFDATFPEGIEDFTGRGGESFIFSEETTNNLKEKNTAAIEIVNGHDSILESLQDKITVIKDYYTKIRSNEGINRFEKIDLISQLYYVSENMEILSDYYKYELQKSKVRRATPPTKIYEFFPKYYCHVVGKFLYLNNGYECMPYSQDGSEVYLPKHIKDERAFKSFLISKAYKLNELRSELLYKGHDGRLFRSTDNIMEGY